MVKINLYILMQYRAGYLLLLCFLACLNVAKAQYYNQSSAFIKANSVWAFGDQAGLNFNTAGLPDTFTSSTNANEGPASAADPYTGELMFYSNGPICWNRNHIQMPNGDSLLGNSSQPFNIPGSTAQGLQIIQTISDPNRYYLFSLAGWTTWIGDIVNGFLYYSVIDMTLDGGLGDIPAAQKNILLCADTLSEGMTAIPGNNCDIWLIVHKMHYPQFLAYHITEEGVDPSPVISPADIIFADNNFSTHTMAVSPDRQLLAVSDMGFAPAGVVGHVVLYHFDPSSGVISSLMEVGNVGINGSYTVGFSPDGSKLYMTHQDDIVSASASMDFIQYDLSVLDSAAIASSKVMLGTDPDAGEVPGYVSLYGGKVYISSWRNYISVINNPNLVGTACDLQIAGIPLSHNSRAGLHPEVLLSPLGNVFSTHDTQTLCVENGHPSSLYLNAPEGYQSYLWENGADGTQRLVTSAGTYWVSYQDECHTMTDTFIVKETTLSLNLGNDVNLCDEANNALILNAYQPEAVYLWQDNSSDSLYKVTDAGTYWVKISNGSCSVSDTIIVDNSCNCTFLMPTVFSPNGDGINDILLPVVEDDCRIDHVRVSIYNRYGENIFNTLDINKGWDGSYKGKNADVGVYMYQLTYEIGGNHFSKKGDIALVR